MRISLCLQRRKFGKLRSRSHVAATGPIARSRRFLIEDKHTKLQYLIDSGADVSILPASRQDIENGPAPTVLYTADLSPMVTYGAKLHVVDIGLRRPFKWIFILAQVQKPILGADFLAHFNLLVDVRNRRLIDGETQFSVNTQHSHSSQPTISLIVPDLFQPAYQTLVQEFTPLFHPTAEDSASSSFTTEHVIETSGQPVVARARRLPPHKLKAARDEFQTMIDQGVCRPSKSNWASPLHLVPKKDGSWRPCGDYRALNRITKPDRYPVPYIQDCTSQLAGSTIFSKIDLFRAYNQVPVAPDDVEKTAVITPFGLFEFLKMPFGLRNAAQTFQRLIDEVTRDLPFVFAYLDDCLIFSSSEEEHLRHLRILFTRFRDYSIRVNLSKCEFGQTELDFLGYRINAQGSTPPQHRVKAIQELTPPKDHLALRRFLGTLNFYRQFLPHAAEMQAPLHAILPHNRSSQTITWTQELLDAFRQCQDALAKAAMLAHPRGDLPLFLVVDASGTAVGASIEQLQDGLRQPVAFYSKNLTPTEQHYSTYDRELLGIYKSIKHFRSLLEGRDFCILTDHKPLMFAFQQKPEKASPRQLRHLNFISQFSTDIRHISGVDNTVADFLSRVESVTASTPLDMAHIALEQATDTELQSLLASPANTSLKLQANHLQNVQQPLYVDDSNRIYIPQKLRPKFFQLVHELCHPSGKRTSHLVRERFVWPHADRDCRIWAKQCHVCQTNKISRHTKAPVTPIVQPDSRFKHVHIDIVGPLPVCMGQRYLLTMIDRYSSWPEAVPIPDITADTVARAFFDSWVARFGLPESLTSDRGRQFTSDLFKQLNMLLGVRHFTTTAYHPQSNGKIERLHRTLKSALKTNSSVQWVSRLPTVLLGLRSAVGDSGFAPSILLYGQSLRLPGEFFTPSSEPQLHEADFLKELHAHFDVCRPTPRPIRQGSVFVQPALKDSSHVYLRTDTVKHPLQSPYTGPYEVIRRTDKFFTINKNGTEDTVSIDRLKAAYRSSQLQDDISSSPQVSTDPGILSPAGASPPSTQPAQTTTAPRHVRWATPLTSTSTTRSGRTVRLPVRFGAATRGGVPVGT